MTLVLLRNSAWMLAGNVVPMAIQIVYFLLLTTALGAAQYGEFVALVALANLLVPFAGLGAGTLLVRDGARRPEGITAVLGGAVSTVLISGAVLTLVFVALAAITFRTSPLSITAYAIAVSELVLRPLIDLGAKAFQALDRLRGAAAINIAVSASRLTAITVLMATGGDATSWPILYMCSGVVALGTAGAILRPLVGLRTLRLRFPRMENLRTGVLLAASGAAQSISGNVDKVLLMRLASEQVVGVYGATARALELAMAPARALAAAAYSRVFREGAHGVEAVRRFAWRILLILGAYGVVAGIAMFVGAPLAGMVLGRSYTGLADLLRIASVLPLLRAASGLAADALTGADRHMWRTALQAVASALVVASSLVLIPALGARGALYAVIIGDSLAAILMWLALWEPWRYAATARRSCD